MQTSHTCTEPILTIQHYQKRYGNKVAVQDLSLTVKPGDIYGFIGHNGAGKTTLIRSIVGVHGFDAGSIRICDIDITKNPVAAKQLGRVPICGVRGVTGQIPESLKCQ